MVKKILFLDILTDNPERKKEFERKVFRGPHSELLRKAMGVEKKMLMTVDATKEKLPNPSQFNGIIIGGSLHNPIFGEEKLWMKKVYNFIREIIAEKIPLLGICGGHQFIVKALGGKVIYNPKGRELGTIEINLTKEGEKDPLFLGIPKNFKAQLSHKCIVEDLKSNWQLLASSELCQIQAAAINHRTRIVQFHPEFKPEHLEALIKIRKSILLEEGFVKDEKDFQGFLSSIQETQGANILKNFLKHFVLNVTK